jgi:hypothetical protein
MSFKSLFEDNKANLVALAEADEALKAAKDAFDNATQDHQAAVDLCTESNDKIKAFLSERGHCSLRSEDGTYTVYHATDAVPEGWAGYHPIPGEAD